MASVLLLAMLAFQPTLIYGAKNLASARTSSSSISSSYTDNNNNRNVRSSKYGKRHSAEPLYSPALSTSSAKLVMSMESGDVLVRAARGALTDNESATSLAGTANSGADGGKRQKNNNNKKINKTLSTHESATATSSSSSSSMPFSGRKRMEKKLSTTQHQQNNRGNNKQRQMLKSQNHEGKRSGGKANKETVQKLQSESEKPSTTCRYAKSAWTECDLKTNTRSRTLTLKKGEPNCLPTRTMEKKCKKSCRYEKGTWSECTNGQMTREDKLKATGGIESSCEPVRNTNKNCNPNNGANKQGSGGSGKKERKNKEKGTRRVIKN